MVLRSMASGPCDRDPSPSSRLDVEENSTSIAMIDQDVEIVNPRDFGVYQLVLFIITQLGYLPVCGGMLATTFFEPTKSFCNNQNDDSKTEFYSLLMEWDLHCRYSSLAIMFSTIVMLGAVVGAFLSGFLADRFGRKPVVVGSMLVLFLGHGAIVLFAAHSRFYAIMLFFTIGCSSGGYIVVNLVLMIESLEKSRSRLLVVSLNGWPIGMSFVALIAYGTRDWRDYHIVMSITAACLLLILQLFSLESVRWLINNGRLRKADKIQVEINSRNKLSPFSSSSYLTMPMKGSPMKEVASSSSFTSPDVKTMDKSATSEIPLTTTSDENTKSSYTYFDLFRYKSVLFPLLALFYSFTSSSIISFGFYFTIEILPGNRYVNLASMGLLKLGLGFLPFVFSLWVGRRPIFLVSIGVACISSAFLVIWQNLFSAHWIVTILSLLITASMDPAWKINHLYSAELFPTVVRNMCRAVCNVGARFGSLIAPAIIHLRHEWELLPYMIFLVLLTGQFVIGCLWLPETKDRPLLEDLPEKIVPEKEEEKMVEENRSVV